MFIIVVTPPFHYFCAVGFTTLSVNLVVRRRIVVSAKIGKNQERKGFSVIQVLFQVLYGGAEESENKAKTSQTMYLIIRTKTKTSYVMNTNLKLHRYTRPMDFSFTYVSKVSCFTAKFILSRSFCEFVQPHFVTLTRRQKNSSERLVIYVGYAHLYIAYVSLCTPVAC